MQHNQRSIGARMNFYLATLLLTIVLELTVVVAARRWRPSLRAQPILATCVCLNLLTHPLATLASLSGVVSIPIIEAIVIVFEAIGYWQIARVSYVTATLLAVFANVASMLVGLLVSAIPIT